MTEPHAQRLELYLARLYGGREGVVHGRRRLVNTLLDREWTEPLPIYAFAIEHPRA